MSRALTAFRSCLTAAAFVCGAGASAETASEVRPTDALLALMGVPETIEIMQAEGIAYATGLAEDMVTTGPGALWPGQLETIYDPARMLETVQVGFWQSYAASNQSIDGPMAFYGSDLGEDIVRLEVSAREAMSDEAIEDAARTAYTDRAGGSPEEDARLALLEEFVTASDLIEQNVVGGLNTTIRFYQGLVDGGAFAMTEEEILIEVAGSEEETRADTVEWVYGFLMLAYRPLDDAQLTEYLAFTKTAEGQAMTRALFAGFDKMYNDISYALGLAIAGQMQGQDL